MYRFAASLLVALLFCEGASAGIFDGLCASAEARHKAQAEAHKIPPANLSEAQIAVLKDRFVPKIDQIIWLRAGHQSDGATFVCFVFASQKPSSGRQPVAIRAGVFESDGSFHQTWGYLFDAAHIANDCRNRGFNPPVKFPPC